MNNYIITYKRGYYYFGTDKYRCLDVYCNDNKIGSIYKCDVLKEYSFAKDEKSEFFVGGLTLKECKENIKRNLNEFLTQN